MREEAHVSDDLIDEVSDDTVLSDDTMLSDRTVVRRPGAGDQAVMHATEVDDLTVVREPIVDDHTVVRPLKRDRGNRAANRAANEATVAPPIEEPATGSRSRTSRTLPSLDPQRRIAEVPGRAPWQKEPTPVRGVNAGSTIVYGTRSEHMGDTKRGVDYVHMTVGPAPEPHPVEVRAGRQQLPSLAKRSRRMRRLTLAAFALTIVASATGLWFIVGALLHG